MKYIYQARTKEGKIETGTVEASSKEAAALLLQKYNIFVTSLKEEKKPFSALERFLLFQRISKKDLAIFSRQLAVMLKARVPVVQSLRSLALQSKNKIFKEKILKISQMVEEGTSLSEALSTQPDIFNIFYVSLVKTGEASGKISDALFYLSEHLEREYDISIQLRNALIYPAFVIFVLIVVVLIVMFFVMPRLVDLLKETTTNPPFFTSLMINFYAFLRKYGLLVFFLFSLSVALLVFYFVSKEGKKKYDKLSLKIPFAGEIFKKINLIRFAENIATLISAGLSITNALRITKDTLRNSVYHQILEETEKRVSEGEKISAVLVKYPKLVPSFVVQMIQVGEETGRLENNLMEIVNFYQKEVNRAVALFATLLEPILIIFLGIIVAILAISIIEPLYGALGTI